jgi:hypothetical protein
VGSNDSTQYSDRRIGPPARNDIWGRSAQCEGMPLSPRIDNSIKSLWTSARCISLIGCEDRSAIVAAPCQVSDYGRSIGAMGRGFRLCEQQQDIGNRSSHWHIVRCDRPRPILCLISCCFERDLLESSLRRSVCRSCFPAAKSKLLIRLLHLIRTAAATAPPKPSTWRWGAIGGERGH